MAEEQDPREKTVLIPPAWFVIFVGLEYVAARAVPGPGFGFPGDVVVVALLTIAGLAIPVIALVQFARARTTYHPTNPGAATSLVTGGIYQTTRNPMYVGMALLLAALAIKLGAIWGYLLVPLFIGVITMVQIVPEERALLRIFGEDFLRYKAQVPRWLFL